MVVDVIPQGFMGSADKWSFPGLNRRCIENSALSLLLLML